MEIPKKIKYQGAEYVLAKGGEPTFKTYAKDLGYAAEKAKDLKEFQKIVADQLETITSDWEVDPKKLEASVLEFLKNAMRDSFGLEQIIEDCFDKEEE